MPSFEILNYRFLIIMVTIITSSCATIVNRKTYTIKISSIPSNSTIVCNDSNFNSGNLIKVKRSNKDLIITVINDSVKKNFTLKSSINPEFLYGNLGFFELCPIGYLIDLTNQKKYYYGNEILLDMKDTLTNIQTPLSNNYHRYFSKKFITNLNQINLLFSIPFINHFCLRPINENTKMNIGFWGISIGLEYFYKENKSVILQTIAASDYFGLIPVDFHFIGEYEIMNTSFISLTNNYMSKRFSLGYGLSYSKNTWKRTFDIFDPPSRNIIKKNSDVIGFAFTGYHQFCNILFLGLIYRPSIISINPEFKFQYEHLISLDFLLKLRFKK